MGWLHLLRVVHLGMGVIWVGAVFFIAAFLFPSVMAAGPAGGAVMNNLVGVRKLPRFMNAAAGLTILSGLLLYWRDSVGMNGSWMRSGPGIGFGIGAVLALAAAIVGSAVNAPTAKRMGALGAAIGQAGGRPTPEQAGEMARLQSRMLGALRLVAVLLIGAVLAMAVARYLP